MADSCVASMIKVGKPFPWAVPVRGSFLDILPDGLLCCMFQTEVFITETEKNALRKSFTRYGYLESGTTPPVAVWTWIFPPPLNIVSIDFYAPLIDQEFLDNFFEMEDGKIKNVANFCMLNGNILCGIEKVELDPVAVKLFRNTIIKQTQENYSPYDYARAVKGIFSFTDEEIFEMSVKFKRLCKTVQCTDQ